jgi:hypothetical protein
MGTATIQPQPPERENGAGMMRDARDLALEYFADVEQQLLERVASVEDDCETYRALALAAFDALRDLTVAHLAAKADRARLTDENRRLREDALLRGGVEDV